MNSKLLISPAPHIHHNNSTQKIMLDVVIALIPTILVSILFYGPSTLLIIAIAAVSALAFEWFIQKYVARTKVQIGDLSALVTGLLLALNLPPSSPWWLVLIGSFVAIAIAKLSFGGVGQNLFNPALVGRVFLLISFPVLMTDWSIPTSWFGGADLSSGATILSIVKEGVKEGVAVDQILSQHNFTFQELFFLRVGGSVGELSSLAILIGFIYLLIRKVIKPHITLSILGTVILLSALFWWIEPALYPHPLFVVFTGGIMLGSVFMATDYVTSPMGKGGMVLFGIGIGVITVLIRNFGVYPEGVSFAILIMNATVPLINKYVKPKKFGRR
ncbi:MAG: RnfABCDGE type electron transport complex subunit D [Bacteroidales bacterium]